MPRRLTRFSDLMKAATSGSDLRAVLDYARCKLMVDGKEEPSVKAIGGMTFTAWEFFEKGVVRNPKAYLTSSETILIAHPRYGYVYNYVKVRIYEDDAVEIIARYLKTGTMEVVMDETFLGKLGEGVQVFAA
jgi:hypothetical protein